MVKRIGLMAAEGALRRLRETRRGPMLNATQVAFAKLTQGEWTRLETQPSAQGERLAGRRGEDETPVDGEGLSTGARGQLYLASRIAGHANFVNRYGPLPFVTDDILETFDNQRAAAALELTGEIERRGQAIMFTHHEHLVDMAQRLLPEARLLKLNA